MSDSQRTQIRMIIMQLVSILEVIGNLSKCGFTIKKRKSPDCKGVKRKVVVEEGGKGGVGIVTILYGSQGAKGSCRPEL